MPRNTARLDLIERLLPEITDVEGEPQEIELAQSFSQTVLRRVDADYLYRHRLTTLGAQLRDSFAWLRPLCRSEDVKVRVFSPTTDTHGYHLEGRVIETIMPDQPFIVDTLKLWMSERRIRVQNSLNVILPAVTDEAGQLVALRHNGDAEEGTVQRMSYTRWFCDWPDDLSGEIVTQEIRERLRMARLAVRDFHRMVRAVKDIANDFDYLAKAVTARSADCTEVQEFLNWLVGENFVFTGISVYKPDPDGGYLREPALALGVAAEWPENTLDATEALEFLKVTSDLSWPLVRVRKSVDDARVHRAGKVDQIIVRTFDDQGNANGGCFVQGMFTFQGLSEPGSKIPILRRKIERIVSDEGAFAGSYEHKGLLNAFNTLPVEYLFEADPSVLQTLVARSVSADDSRQVYSQLVLDPEGRSAFAFIVLPKEHYSDDLRATLQSTLQRELRATYADHRVHIAKTGSVALHFYLTGGANFGAQDTESIETRLVEIGTPWYFRLRRQLEQDLGEVQAATLYSQYAEAFPEAYRDITPVEAAVVDVHHIGKVAEQGRLRFDIFPSDANPDEALLRIYSRNPLQLTEMLPNIDNFGVAVLDQNAFEITPTHSGALTINSLRVQRGDHDLLSQRVALIDGLRHVFDGKMRSDGFNHLLLPAQLDCREVDLLRGYYGYCRQLGYPLLEGVVEQVLLSHAEFVAVLLSYFRSRFDPSVEGTAAASSAGIAAIEKKLATYLDGVQGYEEDRILRAFLNLMTSTVRTNFYRERPDNSHFISFKIESARVAEMPDPRPLFEIYVHHARMEGIHLRGGRVARGGLRWSDRLDDFRTEILDLMNTQMLKNTLIVPVGAKGGFVLTEPVDDPAEGRQRADALYQIFIRGLLEVTDNLVDGAIAPPPNVRRHDGDDPYLVVAADKGTAHLSDTANGIAKDFNYWMGDAFASGGSVGYDHKVEGITARGAWVCVRRHFAEMGRDPEIDTIRVVGIGDMSGDVFGNGMLLSRSMKLVAAFNHRHIFIDPDPDPAASWVERERLFKTPGSVWTDYNPDLISSGGGIFDRGAKSIQLSPEARQMLGTVESDVSGEALVRLLLKADVDLLWNGGIGTYVKASAETHAEVGDQSNDRVRVNANTVRARVIGEGGNLGFTMRARVEYAARGGRLNLDATDNSGGVDLSDHEVNLKILLQPLTRTGQLAAEARAQLLRDVGDDVCDLVLDNNERQSLAISLDELRSRQDIWPFVRATNFLALELGFSRHLQRVPSDLDQIEDRVAVKRGFLRPEVAKLISFSKMLVFPQLVGKPIGTAAELRPYMLAYFPSSVVREHPVMVDDHMLSAEIAATVITNQIVEQAGITFFPRMLQATGRSVSEVAAAYLVVDDILGTTKLRARLRDLDTKSHALPKYLGLLALEQTLSRATHLFLELHEGEITLAKRKDVDAITRCIQAIIEDADSLSQVRARRTSRLTKGAQVRAGLPTELNHQLNRLNLLVDAILMARVVEETGVAPTRVAPILVSVGHAARLQPLIGTIERQRHKETWDRLAIHHIMRALRESMLQLAGWVATHEHIDTTPEAVERALLRLPGMTDVRADIDALLQEHIPVSAMFVVGERLRRQVEALTSDRD